MTDPPPLFATPLQEALLGPQGASLQAATRHRLGQLHAHVRAAMEAGLPRDAFTAAERLVRMLDHAQRVLDSLPCTQAQPLSSPATGPAAGLLSLQGSTR